jgi:hypothetical protein
MQAPRESSSQQFNALLQLVISTSGVRLMRDMAGDQCHASMART